MPSVPTPFSGREIDLVVVRENVEDLYAGIEHMHTPDVAQCLELVSRLGCRRVMRTALELEEIDGEPAFTKAQGENKARFRGTDVLRQHWCDHGGHTSVVTPEPCL